MVATNCNFKVVKVEIELLQPYPLQSDYFPDTPTVQLRALTKDIEANGLQQPILVTSDDIIISGHRRVAAAKQLGWKEIDAIVRRDLADDEDAADQLFINENFQRRHLSTLQKARCVQHLWELAKKRRGGHGQSVRNFAGHLLGMYGPIFGLSRTPFLR